MRFKTVSIAFTAFLLCLPASAGWARGDAGASVSPVRTEAPAAAPALADQIDALLTARFTAAGAMAGEARRRALKDLESFAAVTVEGLIGASPSSEMRALMDARLRPVLARHQDNIAAALAALGERPSARTSYPLTEDALPRVATAP